MPVDGRRLGQTIRETHLEDVADTSFEDGARNLAVESPGANHGARRNGPIDLAGLERDGDDLSTGGESCLE